MTLLQTTLRKTAVSFLAISLALAPLSAYAVPTTTTQVSLTTSAYVDLGVGPMILRGIGGTVFYTVADTLPAGNAPALGSVNPSETANLQVTAHVYARGNIPSAAVIVAIGPGITGWGGTGGGGSGGPVSLTDGADVTQGSKADARSTATDATPATLMQIFKEISEMEQRPASRAVTFASPPTVNLGTLNGAATAANQTNGTQKMQIVDGAGNVVGETANNLNVQCANCSGSGVSAADGATFTPGTSAFAEIGGLYQTTPTSNPLATGKGGSAQLTQYRALMTAWFNSLGVEMGTAGAPVRTDPTGTTPQPITQATNVTPNDCSGSITTGGTAQPILAAQTTLHGMMIQNLDTTEPMWISFNFTAVGGASGSYVITAGSPGTYYGVGSYSTPPGFGVNHAISGIAATSGHKYSCTWN